MQRRNFISLIPAIGLAGSGISLKGLDLKDQGTIQPDSREFWISVLTKIADPVLIS